MTSNRGGQREEASYEAASYDSLTLGSRDRRVLQRFAAYKRTQALKAIARKYTLRAHTLHITTLPVGVRFAVKQHPLSQPAVGRQPAWSVATVLDRIGSPFFTSPRLQARKHPHNARHRDGNILTYNTLIKQRDWLIIGLTVKRSTLYTSTSNLVGDYAPFKISVNKGF